MPVSDNWTPQENRLIKECYELMPDRFRSTSTPSRILQFIELVVADINVIPPVNSFDTSHLPTQLVPIVRFGVSFYATIFHQLRATLDDFEWGDQGVTVRIDQTSKLNVALINITKTYERMIMNFKRGQVLAVGGRGVSTPRFQSQLGQFLKIQLGCLAEGVLILTKGKIYIPVEKIFPGHFVFSHDEKFHKVLQTSRRFVNETLYEITANKKVLVTANHPFLVNNKDWIRADKLKKGDILKLTNSPVKISKITTKKYRGYVYNLSVEKTETFNAEGLIVHNSSFLWNTF